MYTQVKLIKNQLCGLKLPLSRAAIRRLIQMMRIFKMACQYLPFKFAMLRCNHRYYSALLRKILDIKSTWYGNALPQ